MRRQRPSPREIDAMAREQDKLAGEAYIKARAIPWWKWSARRELLDLRAAHEAHRLSAECLRKANELRVNAPRDLRGGSRVTVHADVGQPKGGEA